MASNTSPTAQDPLQQQRMTREFYIAFSLMSIIPLLICCYLITVKFFTIKILKSVNGLWFLLAVVFAILGLIVGQILITEVVRRMADANNKLAKLNEMQAQFVNNVAHELRAPLTVIKGALDNLSDDLHGPLTLDQRDPVGMCLREANRLKRLVTDLLDVARLEAGKTRLTKDEVVLQELLKNVVQLFNGLAKERQLTLRLDVPGEPARILGDRDRLQQVFINLLNNAVKFTKQGGITLQLRRNGAAYEVLVEDTGPGIAKEDLGRVFDKFERVGNQTEEGSGLGLPIARDLVKLHEGRLWVESEQGKGSRFIVRLPAGVPKPVGQPA